MADVYPHLGRIKDPEAVQSLRLLWARLADCEKAHDKCVAQREAIAEFRSDYQRVIRGLRRVSQGAHSG